MKVSSELLDMLSREDEFPEVLLDKSSRGCMMDSSRYAATSGALMRPDLSPLASSRLAAKDAKRASSVGLELALPATILGFILIAQFSPMLKAELDNAFDWFLKNDYAFWILTAVIVLLPVRMIFFMLKERQSPTHPGT